MFTRGIPDGLSSMQRFYWKRDLVIDWMVTFRFSSIDILSALTGMKPKDNAYFFKRLIETGVLVRFKNESHSKKDLVRLGRTGWALHCDGELPPTNIRSDVFEKHQQIAHDLGVQRLMLRLYPKCSEIHGSYDRDHEDFKDAKPDALAFTRNSDGKPACIEFEYSKKNHRRIYKKLNDYKRKIEDGSFSFVCFYFTSESDMKLYQRLFDETSWPRWSMKRNRQGKEYWGKDDNTYIAEDAPIRSHFLFSLLENHEQIEFAGSDVKEKPDRESQLDLWYGRKQRQEAERRRLERERREQEEEERLARIAAEVERQGASAAQAEDEDDGNAAVDFSNQAAPAVEQKPAKKGFWSKVLG